MCFVSRELLAGWPQMARGLRCIFGARSRVPGERWRVHLGPQILLEAGKLLLGTAGLYAAFGGVKATRLCGAPRTPWCRQSSAATCMASRSTTAGCPLSAGMRRLPPKGDGCGCGGSGRTGPAALPTWPPMVAEWSGVAGVHLVAPARLLERPRVEI